MRPIKMFVLLASTVRGFMMPSSTPLGRVLTLQDQVPAAIKCTEGSGRDATDVKEMDKMSYGGGTAELVQSTKSTLPSLALPRLDEPSTGDRSGYIVLGLVCAIAMISSLDRVMMSVAILPMSAEMMYSDTTKGLIAAAFTTGYFLFFVPAGVVAAMEGAVRHLEDSTVMQNALASTASASADGQKKRLWIAEGDLIGTILWCPS